MNLAILQEIFAVLMQAIQLGVQYGPEILQNLEQAWHWATTSDVITADQQTAIDAALDAAHLELQNAIAAQQKPPAG